MSLKFLCEDEHGDEFRQQYKQHIGKRIDD